MSQRVLVFVLLTAFVATAAAEEEKRHKNDPWGIAMGFRIARIPYPSDAEQVSDVVPLLFFDNEYFFLQGLTGGVKLYTRDRIQLNLIGRYRFFDIPPEFQNRIRGDGTDVGMQGRYQLSENAETIYEIMADSGGRFYSNLQGRYYWESGSWELSPYATLRYKSAEFNDRYFGLDGFEDPDNPGTSFSNKIGSGWDFTLGTEIRYHLTSNLYLLGRVQATTLLDSRTRNSPSISKQTYAETYVGIAFFDNKTKPTRSALRAKPYWRLAYGSATPSNMGDILLRWNSEDDPQDNRMVSLFYGHPVADSLFGIEAFDLYITPGFVYHRGAEPFTDPKSGITYDQQPTREYVLAMKLFWNIDWPTKWRIGLAEGMSYARHVTNLEKREMDNKGYRASKLLNFIDVSLDFSVGDLFGVKKAEDLWFGYSLHHRSGIFETSAAFGRIRGGSNYNTLYLQYHF